MSEFASPSDEELTAMLEKIAAQSGTTVEALLAAANASRSLPDVERARYRKNGWAIIEPGSPAGVYHGFPHGAWLPSSFLAKKDREVQISLVAARKPGSGAFSLLLHRLYRLGLRVRIVSPLPQMRAILERKGFVATEVGSTFDDRMDIWELPDTRGEANPPTSGSRT